MSGRNGQCAGTQAAQGRTPDRWQRMFDAAHALAQRHGPYTLETAHAFDVERLLRCMARSQPLVFRCLPADWVCARTREDELERACGDLPCADAAPAASMRSFLATLREGGGRGTGGFPMSAALWNWSGLPRALGGLALGHGQLFGGARDAVTPLHRDAGDGLNVHVLGRKHWTLLSPVHAGDLLAAHDRMPDGYQESEVSLARFCIGQAHRPGSFAPLRVVVGCGEAIFVPSGWFHEVRLLDASLSFAMPLFRGSTASDAADPIAG